MKHLKEYFHLSKQELRVFLFFLFLIFIIVAYRIILPYFESETNVDFSAFENDIEQFEKSQIANADNYEKDNDYVTAYSKDAVFNKSLVTLFKFDPNTIDSTSFLKLGLSPKQTKIICNYRRKGGRYYKTEDFKKTYGISEKNYQTLAPFISIEIFKNEIAKEKITLSIDTVNTVKKISKSIKDDDALIEINDADTSQLKSIRGIGSTYAKRIIAYREKLGGYHHHEQLLEVIGIDSDLYKAISKHILIDSNSIRKMKINKVGFYTLKNFPYLKTSQAKGLLYFRDNHGYFSTILDVKKCHLIDDETFHKLKPYITTGEE